MSSALARAGARSTEEPPPATALSSLTARALLFAGVLSSIWYVAMNVYIPMQWDGYSFLSQVPSELSAIDAPTRRLWSLMSIPYTVLLAAFGVGVWMSADGNRPLRIVGGLFVADAMVGAFWPPMHLRGVEPTLTDTLHLVWSAAWLLTMVFAMGFAAAALGKRFRFYTAATLAVFLVFGALTAMTAPRVALNAATPWIGLWERINIAAAMLWIAVVAVALVRRRRISPEAAS